MTISACGGGLSDVENNHPSQFAPKTAPDISVKRNEKNQLIIDWPEQQDSEKYVLHISSSENFESNKTSTTTVTKPPYIVDTLEAGTNYHIKITPAWETKAGPESNAITLIAPPTPPNDITVSETSVITWKNESTSFNVYWSKDPNFTIESAEGSAIGITEKNYQPNNHGYDSNDLVYFIVTAINNDVESAVSDKVQIAASNLIELVITPPNNPKVTLSNGKFSMEWPPVANAINYSVYMAQDSDVTQDNVTSLTGGMPHPDIQSPFGHGLANGSRYYIVVTAQNSNGEESIESTELSVKSKASLPGVPDNISVEADKDHITLSWTAVENALSYNIYGSTSPDVTAKSEYLIPNGADITNTSFIHTGVQNGLMHYYVITAILSTGESEESAEVGATPYGLLPQPSNILTQEANKQISITWPEVPGAVKYHLYMAYDNSVTKDNVETLEGWMKHTENVISPFVHPGLTNDRTNYMRLTAIDKFGIEGIESTLFEATPHASAGNQPPEINISIIDQTATEEEPFSFQFSASTFLDPEDDPLTHSAAQHTLANMPDWLNFDAETRTFSGTPSNTDVGSIDIDLTATDDNGNLVTEVFTLNVINVNDAPTAKEIPTQIAIVGSVFNYQIVKNTFNDIDIGDTLTISSTVLPDWLSFDGTTQTFMGTPLLTDIGLTNINITADDNNGGTVSAPFQLTVVNTLDTPFAKDDDPEDINEGSSQTISVLNNDLQANSPLNPASVTIVNPPSHGSFEVDTNGIVTYTHDGSETITDTFTYTVKDTEEKLSNEATVSININPVNDAPTISGIPDTSVDVGTLYSFTPNKALDPDNLSTELTFSINKQPSWASFNESTGELSGTPLASDYLTTTSGIEISVTDGDLSDILLPAFDITVTGTPPTSIDDPDVKIIADGNFILINVLNNDSNDAIASTVKIASLLPSIGFATPDENGNILYHSTATSDSIDKFTYTVENSMGLVSNEATVTVTINVTPWNSQDIGAVGITGSSDFSTFNTDGKFTVSASGNDMWGTKDQLHYVYKPITGDFDIRVQVTELTSPQPFVEAGIVVRETLAVDSKNVLLTVTDINQVPDNKKGVEFNSRLNDGDETQGHTNRVNNKDLPRHIRLTRRNNTYNAYESADGINWQLLGSTNTPMSTDVLIGMGVSSHSNTILTTASFENLKIINQTLNTPTPHTIQVSELNTVFQFSSLDTSNYYKVIGLDVDETYSVEVNSTDNEDINLMVYQDNFDNLECLSFQKNVNYDACLATTNSSGELYIRVDGSYINQGKNFTLNITKWSELDIGASMPGSSREIIASNSYEISGSGKDIWNNSDEFFFFYREISGNIDITARVSSQTDTDEWAKSGIMIRETSSTNSKFVNVFVTPPFPVMSHGTRIQSRAISDTGLATHNNYRTNEASSPRWIRLIRRGHVFDAYDSSNGKNWLFLGTAYVPMNEEVLVGFAVTSHNIGLTSTALFEKIKVFNSSGIAPVIESVSAPVSSLPYSVSTTDKYIKVTGLIPSANYTVDMANLTDDADLYIYSSNFESLQCPDSTSFDSPELPNFISGTTAEQCQGVTSNSSGELSIRINGSYSSNGANFTLTVTPQ